MGKEQRRNAEGTALGKERGPEYLFSPSRPEIKRTQMERTDCLGRMNKRPKPSDQARPLAQGPRKVKAFASARQVPKLQPRTAHAELVEAQAYYGEVSCAGGAFDRLRMSGS